MPSEQMITKLNLAFANGQKNPPVFGLQEARGEPQVFSVLQRGRPQCTAQPKGEIVRFDAGLHWPA